MNIGIIGNEQQVMEFEIHTKKEGITTYIINNINDLDNVYDMVFDFLYDNHPDRIALLKKLTCPVFINHVQNTLEESNRDFIRFNGWNSFIKRTQWEISYDQFEQEKFIPFFNELGIHCIRVPDIIGFITPRVVSMLINEAYFALGEEVSTKNEIDTAMQLGTNYPYGPFEWSTIIGIEHIYTLLNNLSTTDERYLPAPALKQEALNLKK